VIHIHKLRLWKIAEVQHHQFHDILGGGSSVKCACWSAGTVDRCTMITYGRGRHLYCSDPRWICTTGLERHSLSVPISLGRTVCSLPVSAIDFQRSPRTAACEIWKSEFLFSSPTNSLLDKCEPSQLPSSSTLFSVLQTLQFQFV